MVVRLLRKGLCILGLRLRGIPAQSEAPLLAQCYGSCHQPQAAHADAFWPDVVTFCMLELQLVDQETAIANERGRNSHARYKKRQLRGVLRRLSRGLVVPKRTRPRAKTP